MVVDFSKVDVREYPVLVLKTLNGGVVQTLGYAFNLSAKLCYNEVSEISFDIPSHVEGVATPNYDKITGMMIVDMDGYGQFILRNPKIINDGIREIKSCQGYSLEYEFTRKQVYIEKNTYNFWNPAAPSGTILSIILDDMPMWSVGEVDNTLIGKYRTFESSGENIYNFMKSTLQESYNCIFDFDTYERKIHVRDVGSNVVSSPLFLSLDNLIKQITIEEESDNIVTVLSVNGAEGVNIRGVNPNGTNKIYNLDYYMTPTNFDNVMIDKWNAWKQAFSEKQLEYYRLSVEQALLTSKYMTENAKLVELEGELTSLENIQSTYIQATSDGVDGFKEKLTEVKRLIAEKNNEIDEQENVVNGVQASSTAISNEMKNIVKSLSFEKNTDEDGNTFGFFENDEMMLLLPYFKEDSIEETSFVSSSVESYNVVGVSNNISEASFKYIGSEGAILVSSDGHVFVDINNEYIMLDDYVETGTVTKIENATGKDLYMVSGGALSISYKDTLDGGTTLVDRQLNADVVKATFERSTEGKLIFSAYLRNISGYGLSDDEESKFESGTMSITADCDGISCNTVPDVDAPDAYSTGTEFSFDTRNTYIYFTKDVTEYERRSVEWDLFEYGEDCLSKLAYPSYSFKVDSANFLALDDFLYFARQMVLGNKIYLELEEGKILEPILIGISINFDSLDDLSLEFGDKYVANDSSFKLADLLEKSVSMGSKVDMSKYTYSAFVDSGASTSVRDFMTNALDVAKNKILSSGNQNIIWDESGMHLRKLYEPKDGETITRANKYDDKQIRMINNMIAFTNDGWGTVEMAIGEVEGPNGGSIYGIAAPSIVGTLLAGSNLVIEGKNADGDTTTFRVDSSGAMLHNAQFDIVTNNNNHILLDPDLGFGIGMYPIAKTFEEDDDSTTKVWADGGKYNDETLPDNVKFWVDTEGNIHFKGKLHGASGDFTGIVNASDLQINGKSILKTIEDETGKEIGKKINSSYLDLGNIVIDGENGNISLTGDINIGGNIKWNSSSSPMRVLYARTKLTEPTGAYSAFPNTSSSAWHKILDSSNDYYASYSYDGGGSWTSAVKIQGIDGKNGKDGEDGDDADIPGYIFAEGLDFTNITDSYIQSPSIYGGEFYGEEFNVYPDVYYKGDELYYKDGGSFNIYGGFDGQKKHFLKIEYVDGGLSPQVCFSSPAGSYAYWTMDTYFGSNDGKFGETYIYFYGNVDFGSASVTGVTAVFA